MNSEVRTTKLLNIGLIMVLRVLTIGCCLLPVASETQALPKQEATCPSDIETLMTRMLKDLPGYSNRVAQRSRIGDRSVEIYNYILIAGNPEFEPLPLSDLQYEPELPDETQQVFFTTLERQYTPTEAILLQNYYWLFLTQTSEGWRLVLLFSRLADLEQGDLPIPPQDARNGAIGQGIKLWLKDCRAGVLR
ncbi:hypothetical protein [Crocosphaera chwakensis]|uniref:Uncharacterized protein n=1 Tax=Crocosphaera chwakensis CCY0110 TaxID=391612 RepID=A3IGY4_9CHRO|nr:hypothetical protein [Crocosphaera chwakensis]EAZ94226.1 hypothetical protein CY0110_10137 [Crocosphaera chwakensis CCY0110]